MPYVPPALNAVDFALTAFIPETLPGADMALVVYVPPALNAVDFALAVYGLPVFPSVDFILDGAPGPVESIFTNEFPMIYFQGSGPGELRSRVSGATVTRVASDFPLQLVKTGKSAQLISKWN